MLVGVVVKNNNNEYLLLKKKLGNQIDLGLIGDNVDENNIIESVKSMLIAQVGYDFSNNIDVEPLLKGEDKDGKFCGAEKACKDVDAKCMSKIIETGKAKVNAQKNQFAWNAPKNNSVKSEGENGIDDLVNKYE